MPQESSEKDPVSIDVALAQNVNYALAQWMANTHQGGFVEHIALANATETPLRSCVLKVQASPPFLESRHWRIDEIAAGATFSISDLHVVVDNGFLWQVSEAISGTVRFELSGEGFEPISKRYPIQILAPNQWSGNHLLLPAHVMPNDSEVARINKIAIAELRKAGKKPALDAYQSGSRARVVEQLNALWNAVQTLNIGYVEPPASFGGQRVRTPTQITQEGMGTCMDTTALFAACMEQAGIHPLLALTPDHIFVGAWLEESTELDEILTEDVSTLQKHIDLKEVIFFETTVVTHTPPVPFQTAVAVRGNLFAPKVNFLIDVHKARELNVLPVAGITDAHRARVNDTFYGSGLADTSWIAQQFSTGTPAGRGASPTDTPANPAEARLLDWQNKLIDLSPRNALLNLKSGRGTVRIFCPDSAALEDMLAGKKRFELQNIPQSLAGADGKISADHIYGYAAQVLEKRKLIAMCDKAPLDTALTGLLRKTKSDLEEGGANTLYLALGFLQWTDPKSTKSRIIQYRAPLILIPARLYRKNITSPVYLSGIEEEPRFNSTLLQKLEHDFKISIPELSGELPTDQSGLDVERIYDIVTRAVRNFASAQVVRDVALSNFSFAQYLMWKDLRESGALLKQNPLVKHLVETPLETYRSSAQFPERTKLDTEYPPQKIFMPLPADSSQTAAALAAANGMDFVLFGPPGTGKSQSIANMIAHCLATGKKVLFVSAKKAALDVVYRRLQEVGLADFCLDAHSSQDSRRAVYDQLRKAKARELAVVPEGDWARKTARLAAEIQKLNDYVAHLHREYPNGLSAYRAIGKLLRDGDAASQKTASLEFAWSSPSAHTRDAYDGLRRAAAELNVHFPRQLNAEARGALREVTIREWSSTAEEKFREVASETAAAARQFEEKRHAFLVALSPEIDAAKINSSAPACTALLSLAQRLVDSTKNPTKVLFIEEVTPLTEQLDAAQEMLATLRTEWAALSCTYDADAVQNADVSALQEEWRAAVGKSFFQRPFAEGAVKRKLQTFVAEGQADPQSDLLHLLKWQKATQDLAQFSALSKSTFGLWHGADTDVAQLRESIRAWAKTGEEIDALLTECAVDEVVKNTLRTAVKSALAGEEIAVKRTFNGDAATQFIASFHALGPLLKALPDIVGRPFRELADTAQSGWIGSLAERCAGWERHSADLRLWTQWQTARQSAAALGLSPLIDALECGTLAPEAAASAFETNYLRWWLRRVVDEDTVLRTFTQREQEATAKAFSRGIDKYLQLTRSYLRAKIAAEHAATNTKEGDAEMGLLAREIGKKMRFKPLRKMMEVASGAILRLTPCVMMSPLSVAQYLAADKQLFDMVIFDEASQIPVWDAIGALGRAKQAVIAGDPKQMPPTNFFGRAADEDDDMSDETIESGESILDECIQARVPQRYLEWHYRSRHENLIAFSNHHYYDDGLVTFPAPEAEDTSVSFHFVEGAVYASGKARHNEKEAKAVVADIVDYLKKPAPDAEKFSIGVVTFNATQQKLIEDLLDEERRRDPALDRWFSGEILEPVMVKNLENVQGDERDIIYFSITYGPSVDGRLTMNFGPLSKNGGERRLNVAITRARQQLKVYCSLHPEQIDLGRTSSIGSRDLKHFLEFARSGTASFARETVVTGHGFDSCFEEAVADALTQRGWRVDPQVGVTKFRIDLGVVHPDYPGKYLAGVECDGATYHSAATARDRDKVREGVLRGLGWNILRVWSTDWWQNKDETANNLDEQLRALYAASPKPAVSDEEKSTSVEEAPVTPEDKSTFTDVDFAEENNFVTPPPKVLLSQDAMPDNSTFTKEMPALLDKKSTFAPPELAPIRATSTTETPDKNAPQFAEWHGADLSIFAPRIAADSFYNAAYDSVLREMMNDIVTAEAPLFEDVLFARIAREHGFNRTGNRIRDRLATLTKDIYHTSDEVGRALIWPSEEVHQRWRTFRKPAAGESRGIDDVPLVELHALYRLVRTDGAADETLWRAMLTQCGLTRLTKRARARLTKAIDLAL